MDHHPFDEQKQCTFKEIVTDFDGNPVSQENLFDLQKEKPEGLSKYVDRKVELDQIVKMPLSVSDSGNLPNVRRFSMMFANAKSALMAEKQPAPEQPKEVAREQEAESDASSKPNPKSDMDF